MGMTPDVTCRATVGRAVERNGQLVRALRLLQDLAAGAGVPLGELALRHGTTVRTIRRDLEAIDGEGHHPRIGARH